MNLVSLTQTHTRIKVCLSFLPQTLEQVSPPSKSFHIDLEEMDLRAASLNVKRVYLLVCVCMCVDNLRVSLTVNQSVSGCRAGREDSSYITI